MTTTGSPGQQLRIALQGARAQQRTLPFVGIYDLFSASLAANRFEALFLSGFGVAASAYGLPDIGFIGWGDLTSTTSRLRALLPDHHLLVDMDDGFGDPAIAGHVARSLERCGASGVVLEDQARPRRCGHFSGKQILPLPDYLQKLDAVLEDAKRVQNGLTKTDIDKLDEYYQSIRDIEVRLGKDEQWLSVPKAKPEMTEPKEGLAGKEEIQVMYDLIVAALRTDSTRVLTYRQPVGTLLQSLGTKVAPHDMSHYSPGDRMAASQKRDAVQSELLAGLLDQLKAVKEADGSSLFDHVALAYGSNIRTIHYLDNCPTLLAGGGASLKLGQHLVLPKDTPLCNVWLTMLHGLGLDPKKHERHGDSTGVVKELVG
jgi:hypothetical protein